MNITKILNAISNKMNEDEVTAKILCELLFFESSGKGHYKEKYKETIKKYLGDDKDEN
ncbi:hypothetical protein JDF658_24560, partial [Carboxydocella sp. JDF658]